MSSHTNEYYKGLIGHILILIVITFFMLSGIITSIYHIFTSGKKGELSEICMKIFVLLLTGFVGIKSGIHILESNNLILSFSPVWNIFNGIFLIYSLGFIEEIPFDQKDANFKQVFISLLIVSTIFGLLNFVYKFYWALTFSYCLNYSICLNRIILKISISKFIKLG